MHNALLIGTANNTSRLLALAGQSFLLIDDGPVADAFLNHFPKAKLFDVTQHSFNPLRGMTYPQARAFAETIYSASPQGENTLTVRNGKRKIAKLLYEEKPERLDKIHTADEEVRATIDDLLLSPVLKAVLCNPTNFSFKGAVVIKLDRAQLGDFDAFVLASLLIQQCKQHIIIPDAGFYLRNFHISLIRQNRLTAGVRVLSQLPPVLRDELLLIDDKTGAHCTYEDAVVLAGYAGLIPGVGNHTDFVQRLVA